MSGCCRSTVGYLMARPTHSDGAKTETVYAAVTPTMKQAVRDLCQRLQRSEGDVIRFALKRYLAEHAETEAAA